MTHLPITRRAAATLALVAAGFALPALADGTTHYDRTYHSPRLGYMPPAVPVSNSIHSGGASAGDIALAGDVAAALAADTRLNGTTITVSANNGSVMLSGSAQSGEQGAYAEQCARRVAGVTSVAGTLSNTAG